MSASTNNQNNLLQIATPGEWKDWLFHIQTNLILTGYVETLTDSGRNQFTARVSGLFEFFNQLQTEKAS